ncbi:CKLF-like MARVEL transmembrane domain-containing protein 7 [Microcaecilia unicolor]|uniref:CKLF-like MARVEL transmembrane domain-containing protein 7 n=1 Tax=Microcaecilia unicolor TaxID=1415580 RepID=A0A6P7WRS0_9AMPH|nr:CKLF-like MARVEL transmembrane domain-containing protein 7 [Microcaecilia unicolor]
MSHGVTMVRTTTSSPAVSLEPGFVDYGYARSCSAMLKIAQMVCLLIAFISVKCSFWTNYSTYCFFTVVTICDLIMIFIFYMICVFRMYRSLTCISWPLAEFFHYAIGTLLLLIASIVGTSQTYGLSGLVAGMVFGFLATFLCVVSMWFSYKISCVPQTAGSIA